jgi:hypothetical protein
MRLEEAEEIDLTDLDEQGDWSRPWCSSSMRQQVLQDKDDEMTLTAC